MTLTDIKYETADLPDQICQDLVWWKNPQEVEDSELLRRIMNLGTWEMWHNIPNFFQVHLGSKDYEIKEHRARVLPFNKFCEWLQK